jgi:hypothetical protein
MTSFKRGFVVVPVPALYLLFGDTAWQRLYLLLEEPLGALPDWCCGTVLESHQARQQGVAKGF